MFYTCNTPKTSHMYYRCSTTGYVRFKLFPWISEMVRVAKKMWIFPRPYYCFFLTLINDFGDECETGGGGRTQREAGRLK